MTIPMLAGTVIEVAFEKKWEGSKLEEVIEVILRYDDGRIVRISSDSDEGYSCRLCLQRKSSQSTTGDDMRPSQLEQVISSLDAEILALQMQREAILERVKKVIPPQVPPLERPKRARKKRKGMPNGAADADAVI